MEPVGLGRWTVKNTLCSKLEGPVAIFDRIMTACLSLEKDHAKIISAYAPTLIPQSEVKKSSVQHLHK